MGFTDLEEYQRRVSGVNFSWSPWEWEEVSGRGCGGGGGRVGKRGGELVIIECLLRQ